MSEIVAAPSTLVPVGMTLVPINYENQPIANLPADISGPSNPFKSKFGNKSILTGVAAIDSYTFDEQFQTYQRSGYAMDSSSNVVLGDYNAYIKEVLPSKRESSNSKFSNKRAKISRLDDAMKLINETKDEDGPWASVSADVENLVSIGDSTANDKIEIQGNI